MEVTGYSREQLTRYIHRLFNVADVNGDGVLQADELRRLLQLCGFKFTPSEIEEVRAAQLGRPLSSNRKTP